MSTQAMIEPLIITQTELSPEVVFDSHANRFRIKGRSIMEDAIEFYLPLINWKIEYAKAPNEQTELILDLEYLNSASTRKLLMLVVELEKIHEAGKDIQVVWQYEESDDVMKERGEEIECVVELPFVMKEVKDQE